MHERVIAILAEIKDDESLKQKLNGESDLLNDAVLDSLQLINFILQIEDEFDVEVDFETFDLEHLGSVNRFVDFISTMVKV
jgi:acyl carrier protein